MLDEGYTLDRAASVLGWARQSVSARGSGSNRAEASATAFALVNMSSDGGPMLWVRGAGVDRERGVASRVAARVAVGGAGASGGVAARDG
jgi:hypothetical protein